MDVDIVIGLIKKVLVEDLDVVRIKFGGKTMTVASLKDLLKMKLISNRPEDQSDIAKLRESKSAAEVSPLQALQFLEDMRVLYSTKDEATRAICLRVPENLLRLLKTRAASEGKKYQSLMIEMLREALS